MEGAGVGASDRFYFKPGPQSWQQRACYCENIPLLEPEGPGAQPLDYSEQLPLGLLSES